MPGTSAVWQRGDRAHGGRGHPPCDNYGTDMPMCTYAFHDKGPVLIMGFTFLEDNKLLMDCDSRTLTTKDGGGQVIDKYLPVQANSTNAIAQLDKLPSCRPTQNQYEALVVQHFLVDGRLPPCPAKFFLQCGL